MRQRKVVLITGASSGIGQACATYLHERSYTVYGTSRQASPPDPAQMRATRDAGGSHVMVQMDVTNGESVERAVHAVMRVEGRIDVLVNNAGIGICGAVEDTPIEAAKEQFETNFFGGMRVTRAVLPGMRKRRSGLIVNVSSMAGRLGIPFQGLYSASKFALEGLSEALRLEVRPFGIEVVVLEPGDHCTEFTANRCWTDLAQQNPAYKKRASRALAVMEHDEQQGPPPERIAAALERIIRRRSPRLRYPIGRLTQRLSLLLKSILPSKWFERIVRSYYRLD
jgi:NAD(P)-dependent dehydrogenase (short-subunit alcohol dehydrogenase family)